MSTIKPYKEGICHHCRDDFDRSVKPLIGNLCYTEEPFHYQKHQKGKYVEIKNTPDKKPIKKVSNKMLEHLKEYRKRRDEYFKENPICEFPYCGSRDITLHHSKGRNGSLLTDKAWFKSLCQKHHMFVEENPNEAQILGLSFKRLDK